MSAEGPEKLKVLFEEYGRPAFRMAYRLTGNVEEAKDLVQESFSRVLSNWNRYDQGKPFENWFYSILRHLFLDCARRYEKRFSISLETCLHPEVEGEALQRVSDQLADREEAVLDRLEREENAKWVQSALSRLPLEFRSALVLCDMEGMKYFQIAEILDCPIGTVRSRISRGRELMRALLVDMNDSETPIKKNSNGGQNGLS